MLCHETFLSLFTQLVLYYAENQPI